MPQNQVASGTGDRTMNPADGVGSLKLGPRTHPAHAEGRLVYNSADRDRQNGNPGLRRKQQDGPAGVSTTRCAKRRVITEE